MASLEENYEFWNNQYNWTQYRGDQWSAYWGGPKAQWEWCVHPRIQRDLPVPTILEIGCGQGRWSHFLRQHCEQLILVDISEKCLEVCQSRFGDDGVSYHLTNGRSLQFLSENSIDFAFSFESLIHTELEDLESYLQDLSGKLKADSKVFLHHSNLGSYHSYFKNIARLPKAVRELLIARQVLDSNEWRAPSVTHQNFEKAAISKGFSVLSQELVPWGGRRLTDCFSTLKLGPSDAQNNVVENPVFIERAREIRGLSKLYSPGKSWLGPR